LRKTPILRSLPNLTGLKKGKKQQKYPTHYRIIAAFYPLRKLPSWENKKNGKFFSW